MNRGVEMRDEEISDMMDAIPEKKVNSETFDRAFQIDGVPVWHYLKTFMNSSFIPKPFKSQWEVKQEMEKNWPPSSLDRLKFRLSAFIVRKGLITNEKIKSLISKPDKEGLNKIGKRDVLLIADTDQVSVKDGKLEFLELGNLLSSLKEQKIKTFVLMGDPFSKNSFFKLNRYSPLVYGFITPEIIKASKKISRDLNKKWKSLDEKTKIELFKRNGVSYWKFFENNMDFLFSREVLFILTKYYLTFKEIVEKHGIKVAYLTSFTNFYDLGVLGAVHKLGRRVVYSSHGYTRGFTRRWELMKNVHFAAGGEEHRRDLMTQGVDKERVVVTGYSFLDDIVKYKRPTSSKTKTLTLLTTTVIENKYIGKEEYFKLIRETLAQIKNVPEVGRVVIKLHPREKYKSEYEASAKSLGMKNVEVIQTVGKTSLYSILSESDILMGFGSTAVLEGLMMGKDAIHLEMLEPRAGFEYKEAMLCVKNTDEITDAVKKVLTDKRTQKRLKEQRDGYLRRAFYGIDGKAHERIAKLIKSVVKSG
jgi:hypothetical protein